MKLPPLEKRHRWICAVALTVLALLFADVVRHSSGAAVPKTPSRGRHTHMARRAARVLNVLSLKGEPFRKFG